MDTREKLNEFAELRGWNKNKLIGWSEAADFGDWLVKLFAIPRVTTWRFWDDNQNNRIVGFIVGLITGIAIYACL